MSVSPYIIGISGVKNSGKTTLIEMLVPYLKSKGRCIAVLKHDGHEFEIDPEHTDTGRIFRAGADGTAVFSDTKMQILIRKEQPDPESIRRYFPDADIILLEGMKYSAYPKIEVVRKGNSEKPVTEGHGLEAIATNLDKAVYDTWSTDVPVFSLDAISEIGDFILQKDQERKMNEVFSIKVKAALHKDISFFGPGLRELMGLIEKEGSIRKATERMGMSYSKAWKMLREAEKITGIHFLDRTTGGKEGGQSTLTPEGRMFWTRYIAMADEIKLASRQIFEKYFSYDLSLQPKEE